MTHLIQSILLFSGNNPEYHIRQLEDSYYQNYKPCPGLPDWDWVTFRIDHNNKFIYFIVGDVINDNNISKLVDRMTKEDLENKFEELGQGKIYEVGDPNIKFRGIISGTVLC
jgi:hypothetical protein